MVDLEVRHLRYILAVAEERSFTRAAARLRIAQSALSAQISRIERSLGVRLFDRTDRGVVLTAGGARVVAEAPAALQAVERVRRTARGTQRSSPVGLVRLGHYRTAWMPSRLAEALRARLVDTEVHAWTVDALGAVQALQDATADVVISFYADQLPLPDIRHWEAIALLDEPVWVLLPDGHPLVSRDSLALSDLAGERWIAQPPGSYLSDYLRLACARASFTPDVVVTGDAWDVVACVQEGLGITLSSPMVASAGTVLRPLTDRLFRRIYAAARPDFAILLDDVAEVFPNLYRTHAAQSPRYAKWLADDPSRLRAPVMV